MKCDPGCMTCRADYSISLDAPIPLCVACSDKGNYNLDPISSKCILISCLNNAFNVSNACVQF